MEPFQTFSSLICAEMKTIRSFCLLALLACQPLSAQQNESVADIINRARATVAPAEKLDGLVTLKITGVLEPADARVPEATLLILARKPSSQRLEIRVDDMVETTIINGSKGCIVRSNLNAEASQMRELTGEELDRVRYTTRQFFNFYRPDFKNGEKVSHQGMTTHRGKRAHKLVYVYPDGYETIRYFSVETDELIAVISENGVESVDVGEQTIGGIRYPERIEYYEAGQKLHTVVLHEVEVNKPLPAGIFEIPGGQEK